jgi:hypothetical protein
LELFPSGPVVQDDRSGSGGRPFFILLLKALYAAEHPVGNPPGRQSHIAHSASDAAFDFSGNPQTTTAEINKILK